MIFTTKQQNVNSSTSYYDEGLREYMLYIYKQMSIALLITAVVAFFTGTSPLLVKTIYNTPLQWVVMFAPLIFSVVFTKKLPNMSQQNAQLCLWGFGAIMGLSMSYIFMLFTATSIARTFLITASLFGTMSIYGQTTKKDLTSWHSFLMMGIIGIVIASIVNIFIGSSAIHFVISVISVIAFTGLTAYDTQKLKSIYFSYGSNSAISQKIAIFGALNLYMDFINIFISLMHLFGDRE